MTGNEIEKEKRLKEREVLLKAESEKQMIIESVKKLAGIMTKVINNPEYAAYKDILEGQLKQKREYRESLINSVSDSLRYNINIIIRLDTEINMLKEILYMPQFFIERNIAIQNENKGE